MRERTDPMTDPVEERLRRIEERLDALERGRGAAHAKHAIQKVEEPAASEDFDFDLALIGRTLIVFGGAYLLRALTEGKVIPMSLGVVLGLAYAISWSILALRPSVSRLSAAHHGIATTLTALPLIFEATRRFHVFEGWSSAIALGVVSFVVLAVARKRELPGVMWTFTLLSLVLVPLLMAVTSSIIPFVLYLTVLGIAGSVKWIVALAVDAALVLLAVYPGAAPELAIVTSCVVFAAYGSLFAYRTLVRERDALPFEITQTFALVFTALGGAMWVAASRSTLEVPLALVLLALGIGSYVVSFTFIPRHFATPTNFVFFSSLALLLIIAGGSLVSNAIFWTALALTSAYLASHYRKASLALHAAVFLFAGFAGAEVFNLGFHSMLTRVDHGWLAPTEGAVLLFIACAIAATLPPIERKGTFELWNAAKTMLLAELGWIGAALVMSAIGFLTLNAAEPDAAVVGVARTSVLAVLTVLAAWASRYARFTPARRLSEVLMAILVVKLLWEDFRLGRPATLFISLAIAGVTLILASQLRKRAAGVAAASAPALVH
jgi:hypothetical protein